MFVFQVQLSFTSKCTDLFEISFPVYPFGFLPDVGQRAEEAEGGVGIHVGVTLKVVDEVWCYKVIRLNQLMIKLPQKGGE